MYLQSPSLRHPSAPDRKSLCAYFGWQPEDSIEETYKVTKRNAGTVPPNDDLKKHFKAVFHIPMCNEAVATDTLMSDTLAVDNGNTIAHFFC